MSGSALALVIDARHVAHLKGSCSEYVAPGLGEVVVYLDPEGHVVLPATWEEFPFPLCADCCP